MMNLVTTGAAQIGSTLVVGTTAAVNGDSTLGNENGDVTRIFGILKDESAAPNYSSCGTSPSHVAGGSNWFTVTVGSGGITACTATFASSKTNPAVCIARVNNATEDVYVSSVLGASVTVTAKSGTTDLSGDTISVFCGGDQ